MGSSWPLLGGKARKWFWWFPFNLPHGDCKGVTIIFKKRVFLAGAIGGE